MRAFLAAATAALLVIGSANPAAAIDSGKFESYREGAKAITYDPALVPIGAKATVVPVATTRHTLVFLYVRGLVPNRTYGSHVHVKPCGALPTDAGPHFQNVADPVLPSVDPAYANPKNEIWLDFTTDRYGNGKGVAVVNWWFRDRPAGSVVIHKDATLTHPGHAGTAGPRLACLTAGF